MCSCSVHSDSDISNLNMLSHFMGRSIWYFYIWMCFRDHLPCTLICFTYFSEQSKEGTSMSSKYNTVTIDIPKWFGKIWITKDSMVKHYQLWILKSEYPHGNWKKKGGYKTQPVAMYPNHFTKIILQNIKMPWSCCNWVVKNNTILTEV